MNLYTLSLALTIIGNITYHGFQKTIRPDAHPLVSLVATYTIALLSTIFLCVFFPAPEPVLHSLRHLGWQSWALGLSIVIVEVGYLLVYRSGWNVSVASLYSNICVAVLLIPIGVFLFREEISPSRKIGILFSVLGIYFLSRK